MNSYRFLQARLSLVAGTLGLLTSAVLFVLGLIPWFLAVAAGTILSVTSFSMLARDVARTLDPGARPSLRLALGYAVRLLLTAAVWALLHLVWDLPLAGLLVGTLTVQIVIVGAGMGAALEEAFTGNPGRLRALLGFDVAGSTPGRDGWQGRG